MPTLPSPEHTALLCNKPDLGAPQESLFLRAIMSLGVKMPSTWDVLSPALRLNLASVLCEAAAGYQPANTIAASLLKGRVQGTVGTPRAQADEGKDMFRMDSAFENLVT